jgi:hypothetical protein
MAEAFPSDTDEHDAPFYSCLDISEATDEEVLSLYVIYRDPDEGLTMEPYESMFQAAQAAGDIPDNELAA